MNTFETIVNSWRETPYVAGSCCKGRGVDCVRFVKAVLDEMNGEVFTDFPYVPGMSIHRQQQTLSYIRLMLQSYGAEERDFRDRQRGDVIVTSVADLGLHIGFIWLPDRQVSALPNFGIAETGLTECVRLFSVNLS